MTKDLRGTYKAEIIKSDGTRESVTISASSGRQARMLIADKYKVAETDILGLKEV